MDSERLGRWLTVAANLGVLGGLALLAYELNQNTQLLRAQAVSSQLGAQVAAETAFMGEGAARAFSRAMLRPSELSEEEMVVVWAYLNTATISAQEVYMRSSLGLATEEDRLDAARATALWIGFPFGRAWWEEMKFGFPQQMVTEVDASLVHEGEDRLLQIFSRIRARLEQLPSMEERESPGS
jgi:hypothetical protein